MKAPCSPPSARPRWETERDRARPTYGPAVARVAAALGRPLLPWQAQLANVAGETLPDGRMAHPLVIALVPRRAGKTVLTLATLIQRAAVRRDARCWYTAQTAGDAARALRDEWLPLIDASPLARSVGRRLTNGSEHLRLPSIGGRIGVFPPGRTGLHGQDADVVVVDEAWAFSAEQGAQLDAAIGPAQATRPGRQRWIISAGGDADSTWLLHLRDVGRAAAESGDPGLAYVEFSADPDLDDLDDPTTWARVHPAVGHTIDLDALRADRAVMDRDAFNRGYLTIFTEHTAEAVIERAAWAACADPGAAVTGRIALAYDVAVDLAWSSIAVASRAPDGRVTVELAAYLPGTGALVAEVERMRLAHRATVAAPPDGPATIATTELRRRGVEVDQLPGPAYSTACQALLDDVRRGQLVHRGQRALDVAARGAARRELGDGWAWTRKASHVDVSPIVAATVAAHRARSLGRGTAPLIRLGA